MRLEVNPTRVLNTDALASHAQDNISCEHETLSDSFSGGGVEFCESASSTYCTVLTHSI